MNPNNPLKEQNGSMTVEAAIIVPVMILCIAAVMGSAIVLYKSVDLQIAADQAANQATLVWDNNKKDWTTGELSLHELNSAPLYWRLIDTERAEKIEKLKAYTHASAEKRDIPSGSGADIAVKVEDGLICEKIMITLKESCKIPGGEITSIFRTGESAVINVQSKAIINDPAEFIRNTDFIIDMERELENNYPEIKNLGEKTRGAMADLKRKLGNLFMQGGSKQ